MSTETDIEQLERKIKELDDNFTATMDLWDRIASKDLERMPQGDAVIVPGLGAYHQQMTTMIEQMQTRLAELYKKLNDEAP